MVVRTRHTWSTEWESTVSISTVVKVDTDNPSGALALYESMGYRAVGQETTWRKPLDPPVGDAATEGTRRD